MNLYDADNIPRPELLECMDEAELEMPVPWWWTLINVLVLIACFLATAEIDEREQQSQPIVRHQPAAEPAYQQGETRVTFVHTTIEAERWDW